MKSFGSGKSATLGALLGAGLILWAAPVWMAAEPVFGQIAPSAPAVSRGGDLMVIPLAAGEGQQQLVVVDPAQRVLGVYHVDGASGEITLKSVRNVQWDLQMLEFNGVRPLPREIRSLLEQP